MTTPLKTQKRQRIHRKIRAKVIGSMEKPRLAIFRSNKYMYAQLIDDATGTTLAAASDISLGEKLSKIDRAKKVGEMIAENGKKAKVTKVVFDRGGFAYRGRVQALADAARAGGLQF